MDAVHLGDVSLAIAGNRGCVSELPAATTGAQGSHVFGLAFNIIIFRLWMGSRRCLRDFYRCGSVYVLCMFHTPFFVIYHKHEATEPQRVFIFLFFLCPLLLLAALCVASGSRICSNLCTLYESEPFHKLYCARVPSASTDFAFLLSYNFICSCCCRCIEIGFRFNSRSNIIYHHHVEDVWDHKLWLHKSGSQLNEDARPIPSRALINDPTETGTHPLFSGLAPPTRQAAPLSLPNHCKTKVTVT